MSKITLQNRKITMDIETAPMVAATFSLFNKSPLNPKFVLQHSFVSCVCWKYLDEDKVYSVSLLDDKRRFKRDHTDDYHVVKTAHEVASEAGLLIGHNFAGFDWKTLNTRFLYHGLGPLPKRRIADTYKIARREFKLYSNRLESIADYLNFDGKIGTDSSLWLGVLSGDRQAIEDTVEYCKQDVRVSEEAYIHLRPFDTMPVNLSVDPAASPENLICPKCGSEGSLKKRGFTECGRYQRYRCNSCTGWSRGKENLLTKKNTGATIASKTLTSE